MDPSDVSYIIILIILLILSAFFSSSETALSTITNIRVRTLCDQGNKKAETVRKLKSDPSRMLSAILIGNNVVNLSASSLTTVLATRIASRFTGGDTGTIIGIATGILTLLILIFGEITPKSLATQHCEGISLTVAPVILTLTRILTPVIFVINKVSEGVMHLMGFRGGTSNKVITEKELLTVVDVSQEQGVIESDEKDLINNVVDFGDATTEDVMIPRIDVDFIEIDADYDEVMKTFREEKHSRMPVYDSEHEHVLGILNLKDLFCYDGTPENFSITSLMRKPYFTYEFGSVSDLMKKFQKNSINMAIVLDEYGTVSGIITMEDMLEEIVGDIRDEYDEEDKDEIRRLSANEYLIDGNIRLDDFNDLTGAHLESEDYDSIAGHMINEFGYIPKVGDHLTVDGIYLSVRQMDRNRIESIYVRLPDRKTEDDPAAEGSGKNIKERE